MFFKIVVALNDLPESQRALITAIDLARSCSAELATVSVLGGLPAYTFSVFFDPRAPATMIEDQLGFHEELHKKAVKLARDRGVNARGTIVSGTEVHAVLNFLKDQKADLLIVGLRQRDYYMSPAVEHSL
jgi:nucleotide-binding universal stress UspA family protein